MLDPSWKDATRQELAAFELNKTWVLFFYLMERSICLVNGLIK